MIKRLILLFAILFIVFYMAFAFVNWDIAWVAHVDMTARWFFILLLVAFFLAYLISFYEIIDKF